MIPANEITDDGISSLSSYLPSDSPSWLRFRIAWTSSKIKQPETEDREETDRKANTNKPGETEERFLNNYVVWVTHRSSLALHMCCSAIYDKSAAFPSEPEAHMGWVLCSEYCPTDPENTHTSQLNIHHWSRATRFEDKYLIVIFLKNGDCVLKFEKNDPGKNVCNIPMTKKY